MAKLVWDKAGDHRYEAGLDRGVLYLADSSGVPWNGLTSVDEDNSSVTVTSFSYDGVKYMDYRSSGDFEGSLKAFTYPDEFVEFDGLESMEYGVMFAHQDVRNRFGLCYRTKVGDDINGVDGDHYRLHILYNLTAVPSTRSYDSLGGAISPLQFSWTISAIPEVVPGYRPTAHVILDTRRVNRYLMSDIEDILYGTDGEGSDDAVVDGGDPIDGNNDFVDGGTAAFSGLVSADGGTPGSSDDAIVYDGGSLSGSVGASMDGGSPSSTSYEEVDGGSILGSGSGAMIARLPSMTELISLIKQWSYISVVDNGDGTWTAQSIDEINAITFTDQQQTVFRIDGIAGKYLDSDTYQIETTHAF